MSERHPEPRSGVVVLVGNPKVSSRTATAAQALATRLARDAEPVRTIELGEVAHAIFDWTTTELAEPLDTVASARLLIAATPTYKASYTGLLKGFLDRYGTGGLTGTISVGLMIGASPSHALAVEAHLRPLLTELGSTCVGGVYLLERKLDSLDETLDAWVSTLPAELTPS